MMDNIVSQCGGPPGFENGSPMFQQPIWTLYPDYIYNAPQGQHYAIEKNFFLNLGSLQHQLKIQIFTLIQAVISLI